MLIGLNIEPLEEDEKEDEKEREGVDLRLYKARGCYCTTEAGPFMDRGSKYSMLWRK